MASSRFGPNNKTTVVVTEMKFYDKLKYVVMPPIMVIGFTSVVHAVLWIWAGGWPGHWEWAVVLTMVTWSLVWLLASPDEAGPPDLSGLRPRYKAWGVAYYCATLGLLAACELLNPGFCSRLHSTTPGLVTVLALFAFALCLYLYFDSPPTDLPRFYLFFTGSKLHARILGIDVKQFTNSRVGMMLWQVLVLANYYHGLVTYGFGLPAFTNFFLQTLYIGTFFWTESWYFGSLDMTLDSAGFYMCWGCLVLLPLLWPLSSWLMAASSPSPDSYSWLWLLLGLAVFIFRIWSDYQRYSFRQQPSAPIWGRPPVSVPSPRAAPLLASGFWGIVRHPNYTFDFLSSLFATLPALYLGHLPFLVVYFLSIVFIHRVFRDEEKCLQKHGESFIKYCKIVPYRLIPYVF